MNDTIRSDCPCTKEGGCPRHGNCTACREFHRQLGTKPPFCERPENRELLERLGFRR